MSSVDRILDIIRTSDPLENTVEIIAQKIGEKSENLVGTWVRALTDKDLVKHVHEPSPHFEATGK